MKYNRRRFIKDSAFAALLAAAGGCVSKKSFLGFPAITAVRSPNGLLRMACIGTANQARGDIRNFRTHKKVEMAAFCDVDSAYLAQIGKICPKAKLYGDFRDMLAKEDKSIDAVAVLTPDHHHVMQAVAAMKAGKHVYLEKPLCKTVAGAKMLRDVAKENGVVTQMGAQFNATVSDRQTVELLRTQALGPVEHVYLFSTRYGRSRLHRGIPQVCKAPDTLDWERWIGPAPMRPYAPKVYHPLIWRIWHDFGSGWIGDMGTHVFSAVWRGMNLGSAAPLDVFAEVETDADPAVKNMVWPTSAHIVWNFAGTAASGGEAFKVEWFDGNSSSRLPTAPAKYRPPSEIDALFAQTSYGKRPDEGKAVRCRDGWILQPHQSGSGYIVRKDGSKMKVPTMGKAPSHYHEFIDKCIAGKEATTDFAWSTYMMEALIIGGMAERNPDRRYTWNEESRSFGDVAMDALLRPSHRQGWGVAGL